MTSALTSVNQVPLIVLTIEVDGTISNICGGELGKLGIDATEIVGSKAAKVKALPLQRSHIKKALTGETFSATSQVGDIIYEAFYHPESPSTETKVYIYIVDVTKRVENEIRLDTEVAEKTKILETTKNDLKEILDNMKQGIITFDADLVINEVSSQYTKTLIADGGFNLTGTNILESIFSGCKGAEKIKRRLKFNLHILFGADEIQWLASESSLPKEIEFLRGSNLQSVKLHFEPIYDADEVVSRMMLVMEDITLVKQLSKEAKEKQHKLQKINDLINVDERLYKAFTEEVKRMLGECYEIIDSIDGTTAPSNEQIAAMLRHVHTLKGSADLFKLSSIEETAHEVEAFFIKVKNGQLEVEGSIIPQLREQIEFIENQVEEYQELRKTVFKNTQKSTDRSSQFSKAELSWFQTIMGRFSAIIRQPHIKIKDIDTLMLEMKRASNFLGKIHINNYIVNYDTMIQKIAENQKKKVKPIILEGNALYFEKRNLSYISDMLIHCVRNAVNHGIESPKEREKEGKPSEGQITISSNIHDGYFVLEVEDNGKGIDPEAIAEKAIEQGFLTIEEGQKLNTKEKINLIFRSGFSTQEEVSVVAGRGVGMDAVKELAEHMDGSVETTSTIGKGTTITIRIPERGHNLISDQSVYNYKQIISKALESNNPHIIRCRINLEFDGFKNDEAALAFGNKICVIQIVQQLLMVMANLNNNPVEINILASKKPSTRRLGSDSFYRLSMEIPKEHPRTSSLDQADLSSIEELAFRLNGSLKIEHESGIHFNLPTQLPPHYKEEPFHFFIAVDDHMDLANSIESYFTKDHKGMEFRFYTFDRLDTFVEARGNKVLFLNENTFSTHPKELESLKSVDNIVCFTQDPHRMDPVILEIFGDEVIVIDTSEKHHNIIPQVVEMLLLRAFTFWQINTEAVNLPQSA